MKKLLLPLLLIITLFACKKEILDGNQSANLHFSNDTVIFDTAFHSIGTPTQTLTVYNRNNFSVLTSISLDLVNEGIFAMNVDGVSGNNQNAIEIPAKDSIFIFLEVTANENTNNEFLLTSKIEFTTGSKQQNVKLVAPGRNAKFYLPHDNIFTDGIDSINFKYYSIKGQKTWTNERPHVIYGSVIIEPNASLTIEEGTEIYFHNNSGIDVGNKILIYLNGQTPLNNGALIIDGNLGEEVVFQGDRSDDWYSNKPGLWRGIHFIQGSKNNSINYAIIRNGTIGIQADSANININNTIIENMSSIGILGQTANISATNTVVSNCGWHTVACNIGGTYNFTHCTFANYWDYNHRKTASLLLNNYYEGADGYIYESNLDAANFTNCIIYGNRGTIGEVSFQKQEGSYFEFNYNFDHCLIKLDPAVNTENSNYSNVIINQSPKFLDNLASDFHLKENSPAIDAGIATGIQIDIEAQNRGNTADIGAYEFKE